MVDADSSGSDPYDDLQLSEAALAALREVQQEQQHGSEGADGSATLQTGTVNKEREEEDESMWVYERRVVWLVMSCCHNVGASFGLSQFWYDEATAKDLAREAVRVKEDGPIVCISSPSVLKAIRHLALEGEIDRAFLEPTHAVLFEYDRRFEDFDVQFVFYDYAIPVRRLPSWLKGRCGAIVADPPFLSRECFTKTCQTIAALRTHDATPVIFCTGAIMEGVAYSHFGLKPLQWRPGHAHQLQNPFKCYVSYHDNLSASHLAGGVDAAFTEAAALESEAMLGAALQKEKNRRKQQKKKKKKKKKQDQQKASEGHGQDEGA